MKTTFRLLPFFGLCLISLNCLSQKKDTLEIHLNKSGAVSFARFAPNVKRPISESVNFLKSFLKTKSNDEFRLTMQTVDKLSMSHYKYQQYFKGIKVENAEYMVHGKNQVIETVNGDFVKIDLASVTPSISESVALKGALAYVKASKYKWQDSNLENNLKKKTGDATSTFYPKGELVIWRDITKNDGNPRLAWKFTISSLVPFNEQWIYMDAATNAVIMIAPLVVDSNVSLTAETRYSGTKTITGDSYAGVYRLVETRNGLQLRPKMRRTGLFRLRWNFPILPPILLLVTGV